MSWDLMFWATPVADGEDAYRIYVALADGRYEAVEADPRVIDFRRALEARYPGVEEVIEPAVGDGQPLDRYVLVTLPMGQQEWNADAIAALAGVSGLTVFDPQSYDGPETDDDDEGVLLEPSEREQRVTEDVFAELLRKHGLPPPQQSR